MNKVFVIQDSPGKNLTPARDFGEIFVMLRGKESSEEAFERLSRLMVNMLPADYLLLIGNPVYIAIASHIAFAVCEGKVNLLLWDREKQLYRCETVEIEL